MGECTCSRLERVDLFFILNDLWQVFEMLYASPHAPPLCPPDLNLAQYTKLLFDKRCMVRLLSLPFSPVIPIAHIPIPSIFIFRCIRNAIHLMVRTLHGPIGCAYAVTVWKVNGTFTPDIQQLNLTKSRFTTLTTPYRYWLLIPMMRTFVHGSELASQFTDFSSCLVPIRTPHICCNK